MIYLVVFRSLFTVIQEFIYEDLKSRLDLAFAWLYEEYSYLQGFNRLPGYIKRELKPEEAYNKLLCGLVLSLLEKPDTKDRDV